MPLKETKETAGSVFNSFVGKRTETKGQGRALLGSRVGWLAAQDLAYANPEKGLS